MGTYLRAKLSHNRDVSKTSQAKIEGARDLGKGVAAGNEKGNERNEQPASSFPSPRASVFASVFTISAHY